MGRPIGCALRPSPTGRPKYKRFVRLGLPRQNLFPTGQPNPKTDSCRVRPDPNPPKSRRLLGGAGQTRASIVSTYVRVLAHLAVIENSTTKPPHLLSPLSSSACFFPWKPPSLLAGLKLA